MRSFSTYLAIGPVLVVPFVSFALFGTPRTAFCQDRLTFAAEINNKPVKLLFDTGLNEFLLLEGVPGRLGIQVTPNPALIGKTLPKDAFINKGTTESCHLRIGTNHFNKSFKVVAFPQDMDTEDFDGIIGWGQLKDKTVLIDAALGSVSISSPTETNLTSWLRFPIVFSSKALVLDVSENSGRTLNVVVDTGAFHGVSLCPPLWEQWTKYNVNRPRTLVTYYSYTGLVVREESWADTLRLGRLSLVDVPIMQADIGDMRLSESRFYAATFGLAVLKSMEVMLDGSHSTAYVKMRSGRNPPYQHNRAGVVFAADPENTKSDRAVVMRDGPAYNAGVRDGDVILALRSKATQNASQTEAPTSHSLYFGAAGTEFELKLRRGDSNFNTTIVLRDILGPNTNITTLTREDR